MLDEREKLQIAEIVSRCIDHKLTELRKEIVAGFAETLDWYTDNLAVIMQATNDRRIAELTKAKREVIEIHTREVEQEKTKAARRGFTAKPPR